MNEQITERFDANNYLFNQDSKLGIYLIHGFSSTTYEVKKIAQHLANQGYYVKADNLPGHGTSIEDCNSTAYTEWLTFVEQNIAELYTHCDKVIVIGVSMGAVLALHLGTLFPLDGIISASALFKFKKEFDVRVLTRLFHRFKGSIKKQSTFHPDQLKVSRVSFYGYKYYPLSAVNEMRKLVDQVKNKLPTISSPVLLMHSKIDKTSLFKNYILIKNLLTTDKLSTLILDKTSHNTFDTETDEKNIIFSAIDNFVKVNFNV